MGLLDHRPGDADLLQGLQEVSSPVVNSCLTTSIPLEREEKACETPVLWLLHILNVFHK